jgi:ABC-type amino acid transport substrate-binding protein
MIQSINSGRIDMVATAVWPSSSRGKHVDFTHPIFFSNVNAYVRLSDARFDGDLQMLNGSQFTIATIDGEMSSIISKNDYSQARTYSNPNLNSVSHLLTSVSNNKADITFAEPSVALEYMSKNPDTIREVANVDPVRKFPNSYMVPDGSFRFQSMLNTAIDELIYSGYVNRVIDKYEQYPNSFERVRK